jgi:hypothetical protein
MVTGVTGCAGLSARKVPYPPAYQGATAPTEWDRIQEKADALKGFRYYLPRPFIALKQEIAVDGASYFVTGTLSDDETMITGIEGIPSDLAPFFPNNSTSTRGIRRDESAVASPGGKVAGEQVQSEERDGDDAKPKNEPKPTLVPDDAPLMSAIETSHQYVPSADATVTVTVAVAAELEASTAFGDGPELIKDKVYLVPVVKGSASVEGLVVVEQAAFTAADGNAPRKLTALVKGSKVPVFASVGIGVLGTRDGKRVTSVLHSKAVNLHNSFATSSEGGGDPGKEKDQDKNTNSREASEVRATISGDPTTDPVVWRSSVYDVILLPDFSQQIAVNVRSGVFKADVDFGLENGWMVEKINASIDNSELGTFLLESAEKVVDAAVTAYFPQKAVVEAAEQAMEAEPEDLAIQAEERADRRVLLRVDFVRLAVPGLHPLASAAEQGCTYGPEAICAPRVIWDTRDKLVITAVGVGGETAEQGSRLTECDLIAIVTDNIRYKDASTLTGALKGGPLGGYLDKVQATIVDDVLKVVVPREGIDNADPDAWLKESSSALRREFRELVSDAATRMECSAEFSSVEVSLDGS